MIQFLSQKTAQYLAKGESNSDIEVLTYGYYMFYQQWLVIFLILLVAIPFGLFFLVLTSLMTSMVLRGCVCGTHATHPLICKVVVFILAFAPAILADVFTLRLIPATVVIMYLFSAALLIKYAPGDTDVRKIHPSKRKRMKIESVIWMTAFFLATLILQGIFPEVAFVVAVTTLITCCFVHPVAYWLFGFDPVTKEAKSRGDNNNKTRKETQHNENQKGSEKIWRKKCGSPS